MLGNVRFGADQYSRYVRLQFSSPLKQTNNTPHRIDESNYCIHLFALGAVVVKLQTISFRGNSNSMYISMAVTS